MTVLNGDRLKQLKPAAHGRCMLLFTQDKELDITDSSISKGFVYQIVTIGCSLKINAVGDDDIGGHESVSIEGGPVWLIPRESGFDIVTGEVTVSAVKGQGDSPEETPAPPAFDEGEFIQSLDQAEKIKDVNALEKQARAAGAPESIADLAEKRRESIRLVRSQ